VDADHAEKPLTVDDVHKLMSGNHLKYNADEKIVSGVILRLPNGYGPWSLSSRGDRGILNRIIRNASKDGELTICAKGNCLRPNRRRTCVRIDEEIRGTQSELVDEDHPEANLRPQDPCAESKLGTDQLLGSLARSGDLRHANRRFESNGTMQGGIGETLRLLRTPASGTGGNTIGQDHAAASRTV